MAENKAIQVAQAGKPNQKIEIPPFVYVIGVFVIAGAAALWFLGSETAPPPPPVLTPEAKAYVRNLRLSEVSMQANESLAKQLLVEIEGKISNNGDRTLKLVEINCVFYNFSGRMVLRERVPIVGRRTGTLGPGQTKPFRLAFDNLPQSWNNGMPQLVIAQIVFL